MDLTMLNQTTRLDDYPTTKKMAELEIGKKYSITALKPMSTKFGAGILATIDDEFTVFLPNRIAKYLEANPTQLTMMSDAAKQRDLQLNYLGGRFNKCEFFSEKSEAMDFGGINHAGCLSDFLPTKKMSELEVNKKYDVTGIKSVKSKFGSSILVAIEWKFTVFLPKRIAKVLEQNLDQLTAMSDAIAEKRLQLHYLGGEFDRFEFCDKASA